MTQTLRSDFSLVGSGHPDQYSYEIPLEQLQWKIISIKRNQFAIFCFQMVISLLTYLATFSGQLYFWRSNFFKLYQSKCFDTTVTLSEELFLPCNCFFEELCFQKIHSLASVFFRIPIFRSDTSSQQPLLEKRKFFRAVTFWKSYVFGGRIALNKDVYRGTPLLKQVLLHSISFFRRAAPSKKLVFQKRNIPHFLSFQSGHYIQRYYLLQQLPFPQSYFLTTYFFRGVAISQLRFLSTTTLTIYQLVIK